MKIKISKLKKRSKVIYILKRSKKIPQKIILFFENEIWPLFQAMAKEGRGAYQGVEANGIKIIQWQDNKVVRVASTKYGVRPLDKVRRFNRKNRDKISVRKYFFKIFSFP